MHSLVVPREHGAWGMLLIPMFVGAVVGLQHGTNIGSLGLFFVAVVFGILTFNFELAIWVLGIQAVILIGELLLLFLRAVTGR